MCVTIKVTIKDNPGFIFYIEYLFNFVLGAKDYFASLKIICSNNK
jgi:hypothetical protein